MTKGSGGRDIMDGKRGGDDLDDNSKKKRKRRDPRRETVEKEELAMRENAAAFMQKKLGSGWPSTHSVKFCSDTFLSTAMDSLYPKLGKKLTSKSLPESEQQTTASQALLVITHSAARATELTRELRRPKRRHNLAVSQLYAKHYKMQEQVLYLRSHPWSAAAVGTPHRIEALCKEGVLGLHRTVLVVIETTPDVKCRRLWDMDQDVVLPLQRFLLDTVVKAECPVLLYSKP